MIPGLSRDYGSFFINIAAGLINPFPQMGREVLSMSVFQHHDLMEVIALVRNFFCLFQMLQGAVSLEMLPSSS